MKKLILLAVSGVFLAAPVQAQSHEHGSAASAEKEHKCAMHQSADHAADPAHRLMPKMVLKHSDMLQLTASQKAELEKMQAAHKQDCEERKAGIKAADDAAAALLEADVIDVGRYEALLNESARLKTGCRVAMVRIAQQAKALLTPEQLRHLEHMSHSGH